MSESHGESVQGHRVVACKECGGTRMRRLPREGFLQKNVYPKFGYFPWECPLCRETQLFRVRGKRTKAKQRWDEQAAADALKAMATPAKAVSKPARVKTISRDDLTPMPAVEIEAEVTATELRTTA